MTVKDKLLSTAIRAALRLKFGRFARILRLTIDSRSKLLCLEILPEGETMPIVVEVLGYDLVSDKGATALAFDSIVTSRSWLTKVLEFALKDKLLLLPEGIPASLLKTML